MGLDSQNEAHNDDFCSVTVLAAQVVGENAERGPKVQGSGIHDVASNLAALCY